MFVCYICDDTNIKGTPTHTLQFENVEVGDRIFVSAQAPSEPGGGGANGQPFLCADSAGNSYHAFGGHLWEASPPNVNEGVAQTLFCSSPAQRTMIAGTDTITVTWDNPVFDRSIRAWLVRHDGVAPDLAM